MHYLKHIRHILSLVLCLSFFHADAANYVYDYNSNCARAYQAYMSLKFPEARTALYQEIKSNPYNLLATYISDYQDFLQLMINSDKAEYAQLKGHFDERLELLEKGDEHNPWYRFCKGALYFHWALIQMRFDENFKSRLKFRKSYLLLKENRQLFPNFEYNNVILGVEETVVGTLPESYQWIAGMLGIKGSIKKGSDELQTFIRTHNDQQPLKPEAEIFYTYVRFYLLYQQNEAWNFINSDQFSTNDNLLHVFVRSNMAMNFRHSEVAIQTMQQASRTFKTYDDYPIFDYQMGCSLYSKLDGHCVAYFESFLKKTKGDTYVKDTWQRMALAYYLEHNMTEAARCRNKIKSAGNTQGDADRQAERFAETSQWPEPNILRARLLIDGGYYNEAITKLNAINTQSLTDIADKTEYYFWLGRAYDELGNDTKAFEYYQLATNTGRNRPERFAARAVLQAAYMYERLGKKKDAIAKYKECLGMRHHDYQNSIDMQAKAGIERLSAQ